MKDSSNYLLEMIQSLVGATIIAPLHEEAYADETFFVDEGVGFLLLLPDGKKKAVWIQSDEEGNDIGFLHIQSWQS